MCTELGDGVLAFNCVDCDVQHPRFVCCVYLRTSIQTLRLLQNALSGLVQTKGLNDQLKPFCESFKKFFLFFSENLSLFICSGVPVDTEVKVLSAEDAELSDVPSFKAGVGQSTALHA